MKISTERPANVMYLRQELRKVNKTFPPTGVTEKLLLNYHLSRQLKVVEAPPLLCVNGTCTLLLMRKSLNCTLPIRESTKNRDDIPSYDRLRNLPFTATHHLARGTTGRDPLTATMTELDSMAAVAPLREGTFANLPAGSFAAMTTTEDLVVFKNIHPQGTAPTCRKEGVFKSTLREPKSAKSTR